VLSPVRLLLRVREGNSKGIQKHRVG
jgi:hypothetical protein